MNDRMCQVVFESDSIEEANKYATDNPPQEGVTQVVQYSWDWLKWRVYHYWDKIVNK
jgi:hypothetical protein